MRTGEFAKALCCSFEFVIFFSPNVIVTNGRKRNNGIATIGNSGTVGVGEGEGEPMVTVCVLLQSLFET